MNKNRTAGAVVTVVVWTIVLAFSLLVLACIVLLLVAALHAIGAVVRS